MSRYFSYNLEGVIRYFIQRFEYLRSLPVAAAVEEFDGIMMYGMEFLETVTSPDKAYAKFIDFAYELNVLEPTLKAGSKPETERGKYIHNQMVLLEVVFDQPRALGSFETTQFQTWKAVALLKGLGFEHTRNWNSDEFTSVHGTVECVFDAWEPSKDGSRLTEWSDLGDPSSPHYGRRYLTAFAFTTAEDYRDVIVWSSSPHSSGQLFEIVALLSETEWKRFVEEQPESYGVSHVLKYFEVKL